MKKSVFFWMLALMICAAGCADSFTDEPKLPMQEASHEVTQAEARQSLEKIIFDLKIPSTRGGEPRRVPPITSVYTTGRAAEATRSGEEIEPYFHIFNFGNDEGFAIMSGDDRVEPLLALTFKGELTPETEIDNPGFEIAYSRMEDYYIQRTRSGPSIIPDILVPPKDSMPGFPLIEIIEGEPFNVYYDMPLGHCQVQWGQTDPYNMFCYAYDEEPAYTGCVATAVAQLMSIYKYPSSYNGYTFDWEEMNMYTDNNTPELLNLHILGVRHIAILMQQIGLSHNLDVDYGAVIDSIGSSAPTANIPRTLENFGYINGGSNVPYNTDAVAAELKAGYPILISGDNQYDIGHQWLSHGIMERKTPIYSYDCLTGEFIGTTYQTSTYILCNMGWDGDKDGYYLSLYFDANNGPDFEQNTTRSVMVQDKNYRYDIDVVKGIRR